MIKIIFSIFLLSSFLNSSMLLDKSYPLCIEDYYIQGGALYYLKSSNNKWASTTSNYNVQYIHSGYIFDSNTTSCIPQPYTILGISLEDWNFLNALMGLLFGFFILVMTSYLFVTVGGKR